MNGPTRNVLMVTWGLGRVETVNASLICCVYCLCLWLFIRYRSASIGLKSNLKSIENWVTDMDQATAVSSYVIARCHKW